MEVKSGRDYKIHSALTRFVNTPDYYIKKGYVLSNSGDIDRKDNIIYLPVYMTMFFNSAGSEATEIRILLLTKNFYYLLVKNLNNMN